MSPSLEARFQATLQSLLAGADRPRLGLAVSGGSDSLALMHLAAAPGVEVATVDHRLRPEAATEALDVGQKAAKLGLLHEILVWDHDGISGNLAAEARRARYRLLSDWAKRRNLSHVLVAHTQDDLAETFLMRLGREAGLDGLAAMRARWVANDVLWLRPLLLFGRTELRSFLSARAEGWIDDPTNSDLTHERARIRKALDVLEPLGVTRAGLAQSAHYLGEARAALNALLLSAVKPLIRSETPLILDERLYLALPDEARRRVLAAALMFVSGSDYPPRREALSGLMDRLTLGSAKSELHGVWVVRHEGGLAFSAQGETTWRQPADFITFLSTH